jgi:hypothetical protein
MAVVSPYSQVRNNSEIKYLSVGMILTFWTFRVGASADQQHCTRLLIAVHYIALYICWQVCRGAVKIILWLWKFYDNFGLMKQHLGCHDGCGLMAGDVHCRILGTALCWNGRSDWLMHRFDVRLYGDRGRALQLQSGSKVQSDSDRKEQSDSDRKEQWTLQSDSDQRSTEHFTVTVTNSSLSRHCYQYMYWRLISCELLNSLSESSPQCACRTAVCCRVRRGFQTALC